MTGYVYGVYHPASPANDAETIQVKIGSSKHDPWRDSLDGRIRKLNLSITAMGWPPVENAFAVIAVDNHKHFERLLHRRLDALGYRVKQSGKRQLTEVFKVNREVLAQAVAAVKKDLGV